MLQSLIAQGFPLHSRETGERSGQIFGSNCNLFLFCVIFCFHKFNFLSFKSCFLLFGGFCCCLELAPTSATFSKSQPPSHKTGATLHLWPVRLSMCHLYSLGSHNIIIASEDFNGSFEVVFARFLWYLMFLYEVSPRLFAFCLISLSESFNFFLIRICNANPITLILDCIWRRLPSNFNSED